MKFKLICIFNVCAKIQGYYIYTICEERQRLAGKHIIINHNKIITILYIKICNAFLIWVMYVQKFTSYYFDLMSDPSFTIDNTGLHLY
jgi:hypothetical protein